MLTMNPFIKSIKTGILLKVTAQLELNCRFEIRWMQI